MQEQKLDAKFVLQQFESGVPSYIQLAKEIGLWESEQSTFLSYLQPTDYILDLGCGTGRTTFGLHHLGFKKIIGVDLTPSMIEATKQLNSHFQTAIPFEVGDACQLKFKDQQFDAAIFSFNGIMTIPDSRQREKAFGEINRVLRENGMFIFTTHDRDRDEKYFDFWEEERMRWERNEQRKDLFEFGDLITRSKNEPSFIFIHIPDRSEVESMLQKNNFKVLETFYREDKFTETQAVKNKSGECRFWVVQKI